MTAAGRKSVVGNCPACGQRTARGELATGHLAEADIGDLTAADELRAWANGCPTFRVTWKHSIQLDARTARDLKVNPAGFDGGRIWKQHECTEGVRT